MKEFIKENIRNTGIVFAGAMGYLYHYRKEMVKALLFPVAFLMVLDLLFRAIPDSWTALGWVTFAIFVLVYAVIAVTVHRLLILGPQSIPEWGIFRPSAREFRFSAYVVGIMLVGFILRLPIALVAYAPMEMFHYVLPVFVIWMIVVGFILARFLLVFPGTAVDQDPMIKGSWNMTRQHVLMVFLVGVVVSEIGFPLLDWLNSLPAIRYLADLTTVAFLVFMVSLLSVAYKVVMGLQE